MRDRWIGTPCIVRLDIYLMGMEQKVQKGRRTKKKAERKRGVKGRSEEKGETENASSRERTDPGWKLKISLPQRMGGLTWLVS